VNKFGILFVCLGNICRSPLAEGIFRQLVADKGLEESFLIDSCGTGAWHIGEPPHKESSRIAKKYSISLDGQCARQLDDRDYSNFNLMVAMDCSNRDDLLGHPLADRSEIICLREHDPEKGDLNVPDPYFGGADGFETVYQMIHRCCVNLLDSLEPRLN